MNQKELLDLIEEVKSSPEEAEHWKIILPTLSEEESQELLDLLQEQKHTKQILAARQTTELADLLKEWNSEAQAIPSAQTSSSV